MSYTRPRVAGRRRTASPEWRNRQTQWTQNPPLARACRFKSGLGHHLKRSCEVAVSRGLGVGVTSKPRDSETPRPRDHDMRLHVFAAVLFLPAVLAAGPAEPIERGRHFILQPQHPLQPGDVAALEAQGLTVQRAMGANRFLVRVRDGADLGSDLRVRSLEAYDWTRKIARSAYAGAASGR